MKNKKKTSKVYIISLIIILLIIFLSMMTYKSNNEDPTVTISVQMFEGPESEAMVPTVEYWNENYAEETGIFVETFPLDRTGYFDKLEVQLISGLETPDIVHPFSLHLGRLEPFLEPLDEYLEDEEIMTSPDGQKLSMDVFLDAAKRTVESSDGKTYMLPEDMSVIMLYYRKDLIPNPPQTWDEYIKIAKKFTRSINPESPTMYGNVLQGKYEMWTFCAALETLWPYGWSIFKPGTGELNFKNGVSTGFNVFEELAEYNTFPEESLNAEHPEVAAIIQEGEVAMAIMWNAFYQDLVNPEKSPLVYDKFEIAPSPGVLQEDGTISRAMYVQTINLAINKNSPHKREAARFMTWATMGEGAEIYASGTETAPGGSTPIKAVWGDDHILDMYPKLLPWVEEFGRAVTIHKDVTDIMLIGASWIQRTMAKDVTAEEASQGLNQEIVDYLKKSS